MSEPGTVHPLIEYLLRLFNDPETGRANSELTSFMDEMPGGFFIYRADDEEQIIYINKAMLRIFKCDTLEEFRKLTGNTFRGIVHPEDLDAVELSIREQIAASKYDLDYVEYRIVCKDGSVRWIEDYGHFVHSRSAGDFFYVFIGDATEKRQRQLAEKAVLIHEKRQHEQNLKKLIKEYDQERRLVNQEQLRRLEVIEGLSINYESILYADLDSDTILPYRLSPRTEMQFGANFQTRSFVWYVSDYVNTWVHPEDRERIARVTTPNYIREKLSVSKTYYVNYRILYNDQTQYLQLRIVTVGNQKRVSQIVMGYRRVDQEIQEEMEQKQLLSDALSTANLAIVAKNTFLANMSHDMRTPLNAIFGYANLAEDSQNDSDALRRYLRSIKTAGSQLLDLIDKVLEISWTESNDISLNESPCNLSDIIQEVHRLLLPQASDKNITFSLHINTTKTSEVYADRDKLRQMLLYIANNAVTYTEPGGSVDLSVTEQENRQNQYTIYQFQIKDTGIGIGKDFLEHIFEPFERENNTTFSGIHGSGLGLTITKNLVDMMGGTIKVDSAVHEGSTFTVTLPLRTQEPTTAADTREAKIREAEINAAETRETEIGLLQNQKILLVEDNEINLEIETEMLRSQGFLIDTATDGSIAVDKILHSNPGDYALILMDIQMPVMDGWQAAKSIRRLENSELSSIPIIALSANAFESDRRTSLESGMDAHLTKPVDMPQLLETISTLLQTRRT